MAARDWSGGESGGMVTDDAAGDSDQREMTTEELRAAARAGQLIGATTPGAPQGVIAPEGLPRVAKLEGREASLERTLASLADAVAPAVIAISGPPGVGKTAFAAEVVARAAQRGLFPGGAVWLSCEGQSGDAGLESAFAHVTRAIGAERAVDSDLEKRRAALFDNLHTGDAPRLLLAFDDVEPALDATALLDTLACGRPALLLTARQAIQDVRVQGEPLAQLDSLSAIELFRQRLHQGVHERPAAEDEPLLANAALATGGLPLAIGLTASLTAYMRQPLEWIEPAASADESRGAAAGMRARFDRSWAALPVAHQRLLAGLTLVDGATFPRGVALAAAGAALRAPSSGDAGEDRPGEAWREGAAMALDALIGLRLVDTLAAGRLRLHPIIRRYAATRLRETPEDTRDALGAAIAGWWLNYASAHEGKGGVAALEAEATGIMGAITWAHARGRHHALLDLTRRVNYAWFVRGRSEDQRHFLSWAVEAARALDHPSGLRAALHDQAAFDARAGRAAEARAGYAEALRLACELGDEQAAAMERHALGALDSQHAERGGAHVAD